MSFRSTLILCVVAIAGVISAVLVERAGSGGGGSRGVAGPLLESGLPVDELTRIRLERTGAPPVVLVRRDRAWWQEEPFAYPMDPTSVRRFATAAAELRMIDVVRPEADDVTGAREALGLAPPGAVIQYEWPDGALELRLGRRGVGGMGYLEIGGDPTLYVVDQELHERAVDMDTKEWRDRTLLRGAGVESDRIEITGGGTTTVLVRERKQWAVESPVRTRVDPEAIDRLLQAIGRARGAGFILDQPKDLTRFGLAEPAATLTVHATRLREQDGEVVRDPVVHRLVAGSRIGLGTEDRFGLVEGRDVVVRLTQAVLLALFPAAPQLVARTATRIAPADVKSILIESAGSSVELRRELERWVAPEWNDRLVPTEEVDGLLEALASLRASDVVLSAYPRELDVATVTLYGYDARPLDTVRIAREPGQGEEPGRWALENGDSVLRIYPGSLHLPLGPRDFGLAETTARQPDGDS